MVWVVDSALPGPQQKLPTERLVPSGTDSQGDWVLGFGRKLGARVRFGVGGEWRPDGVLGRQDWGGTL